jgi:hypothetical protein
MLFFVLNNNRLLSQRISKIFYLFIIIIIETNPLLLQIIKTKQVELVSHSFFFSYYKIPNSQICNLKLTTHTHTILFQ